jgi:hypothetical protein
MPVKKMTRLGLILFLAAFIATSCEKETRPAGVLSKEQYASFLVEVYLTEARFSQLPVNADSTMRLYLAHEPELLKKFGMADSTLKNTYAYYVNHPKQLEEVYTAVIDTLSLREQKATQ